MPLVRAAAEVPGGPSVPDAVAVPFAALGPSGAVAVAAQPGAGTAAGAEVPSEAAASEPSVALAGTEAGAAGPFADAAAVQAAESAGVAPADAGSEAAPAGAVLSAVPDGQALSTVLTAARSHPDVPMALPNPGLHRADGRSVPVGHRVRAADHLRPEPAKRWAMDGHPAGLPRSAPARHCSQADCPARHPQVRPALPDVRVQRRPATRPQAQRLCPDGSGCPGAQPTEATPAQMPDEPMPRHPDHPAVFLPARTGRRAERPERAPKQDAG